VATYYVAKNGNDSWPGSEAQPFLTIQRGYDESGIGDTVLVKEGTYSDGLISIDYNGTNGNPITVKAYTGDTVIITDRMSIEGDWNVIEDFEFVTSNSSSYSELSLLGDNNVLNNLYSHDYTGSRWEGGLWISNPASNNTINNMVLEDGGVVYVDGIHQSTPANNVISGGSISFTNGTGIRMGGYNNTLDGIEIHDCGYGNNPGSGDDDCDGIVTHGDNHT